MKKSFSNNKNIKEDKVKSILEKPEGLIKRIESINIIKDRKILSKYYLDYNNKFSILDYLEKKIYECSRTNKNNNYLNSVKKDYNDSIVNVLNSIYIQNVEKALLDIENKRNNKIKLEKDIIKYTSRRDCDNDKKKLKISNVISFSIDFNLKASNIMKNSGFENISFKHSISPIKSKSSERNNSISYNYNSIQVNEENMSLNTSRNQNSAYYNHHFKNLIQDSTKNIKKSFTEVDSKTNNNIYKIRINQTKKVSFISNVIYIKYNNNDNPKSISISGSKGSIVEKQRTKKINSKIN